MSVHHEIVGPTRDRLGECPLWDVRDQSLYWIDSVAPKVCRLHAGDYQEWRLPSQVGSIALTQLGHILLALMDGFYLLTPTTGRIQLVAQVPHKAPEMRMNDGRVDRQGRFVAGSMVMGRRDRDAAFYSLGNDGNQRMLFDGIALANATCFSPDGRTLYCADSFDGQMQAADYDPDTGSISRRRVIFSTQSWGSGPDGATVDADGNLWVALVQAAKVACFTPSGELLRTVDVPTPYPTCPAFGGPNLDVLYVTSIRNSGHLLQSDAPNAGAILAIHGLGATGLPESLFDDRRMP